MSDFVDNTAQSVRTDRTVLHHDGWDWLRQFWARCTSPRHLSVMYGGVYTIATLTGVVTLIVPPQTIAGELGPALAAVWASLFILGGLLGMVTVLPGWWKWERWSNTLILGGIAIYAFVISTLHFTAEGSRLTQLGVLMLASSTFTIRLALIRGRTYGPRR